MKRNRWTFIIHWGPAVVIMLVIFALSATPGKELPTFGVIDWLVKKGSHMLGYALLALGFLRGIAGAAGEVKPHWKYAGLAILLTALYAMSDEAHQFFVAGRSSEWTDVGIDTTGGLIALFLWQLIPALRRLVFFQVQPTKILSE